MKYHFLKRMAAAVLAGVAAIVGFAQDYSSDVELVNQSGSDAVFSVAIAAEKAGKNAEAYAIESVISTLLHEGVEGLNGGQPMLSEKRKDYDYRLFSTKRYSMMLAGKPAKTGELKYNGMRKLKYDVGINLKSLQRDLEKNELAISHAWARQKETPTTGIRPTIVVLPEMNGGENSFEAMRDLVATDPAYKAGVNKLMSLFSSNGYQTRDFRTALENSKTDDVMREGASTDARTMVVQLLPGDIVVYIDLAPKQRGATNGCDVGIRAVEKQTEKDLGSETFISNFYHVGDPAIIVDKALDEIGADFFAKLGESFQKMAKEGRSMRLDFNISQSVSDWDFDSESPADGSDFRQELEEWVRKNAFNGIYDMSNSTDKYILVTMNIPLWDAENNRSYRVTNFTSALKKFLNSKLGGEYKPSVTSMGQKLSIMIE